MTDLTAVILGGDPDLIRDELRDPDRVCDGGRRPLSVAVASGDLALLDLLVELGVPIDGQDTTSLGYTALGAAVQGNATAAVERLLALGADVDGGDSIQGTPLHHAAVGGQADLAALLLRAGARVDAEDDQGVTPLIRVAVHADAAVVRPLDEHGVPGDPIPHPLHDAHLATAAVLVGAGADVDHLSGNGYSALHHAAENGAADLATQLLAAGAQPGLANGNGYTPLHAACDGSQTAIVRILLTAGASPDAEDVYGFVPLHGAACQGSTAIAQLLLAAGADTTRHTRDAYDKVTAGMTPADVATAYGWTDLAATLA